jgi:membrane-associated phospholipid phosphatase
MEGGRFLSWPGFCHVAYTARVAAGLTLLFVVVYAGADSVTRAHTLRVPVHLDLELAIPFVPAATALYSSVYLMFLLAPFVLRTAAEVDGAARAVVIQILVGGAAFLVLPAEPAYAHADVDLGSWRWLFAAADTVNLTHNMVPSLHVAFATTFALLFAARARGSVRATMVLWGAAVAASTLLTHQHHVADVVTGAMLAIATLGRVRTRDVASAEDLDDATTRLADRIVAASPSREFVAAVDAVDVPPALPRIDALLLVAPAAFYREKPSFGGDGRLVRDVAARFGMRSELLPVASTGTARENGRRIAERLAACRDDEPVVLVSLSKGAADLRVALERLGRRPPGIRVWLQICGLPRGSAYADIALEKRLTRAVMWLYLSRHGAGLEVVEELRASCGPLAAPFEAPDGLLVVNILGFPRHRDMRWAARRRSRAMAAFGPNDGATLLQDAIVAPGVVYPVRGADHYFRVDGAEELLTRLFCHLAASGRFDEAES